MIRSEMIARIAKQNPHLFAKDAEAVVVTILDAIAAALARGDRVELRGFGAFATKKKPARDRRNPKSGAVVAVEAKRTISFKPGKTMQARLSPEQASSLPQAEQLPRAVR